MAIGHGALGETCIWLSREIESVRTDLEQDRRRTARTLIRTDELRVVMVAVREDSGIPEHVARGPITIHVLDGSMDTYAAGDRTTLGAGMLMSLPGGVPHSRP